METANTDSSLHNVNHCDSCGVRKRPARLSLIYLSHRLKEEVFGTERGLLLTIWHLFTRPQSVTSAFIKGDSLRYFSPIKYFGVMFALSLLISRGSSLLDGLLIKQMVGFGVSSQAAAEAAFADWNTAIYLPLVLILAMATRGFFRGAGLNYAEHLVVAAYGWGQMVLVSTLSFQIVVFMKWLGIPGGWRLIMLLIAPAYWFWYCSRVFSQRNLAGWLRAFVTVPFAYVCYLFLFLIVVMSMKMLQGMN